MSNVWNKEIVIAPSLICFDLCNLESQVKELEQNGVEVLHVDILDGYFSPSMPIGLDTVRQLRKKTNMLFDVHLMAKEPDFFIDELLDMGVDQLSFHLETAEHVDATLNRIHNAGVRAGVALKPSTSLHELDYILEKCDNVCLMLLNPGFAHLKHEGRVPYADKKIAELEKMIEERGCDTRISIDGRVSADNIKALRGSRVNLFVAGSTCINRNDIAGSVQNLRTALNGGF